MAKEPRLRSDDWRGFYWLWARRSFGKPWALWLALLSLAPVAVDIVNRLCMYGSINCDSVYTKTANDIGIWLWLAPLLLAIAVGVIVAIVEVYKLNRENLQYAESLEPKEPKAIYEDRGLTVL